MTGTLEDTTPAGVLQVLSSQRSTGAVRFLGASGCTVYLQHGELYFAENTDTAEDLAVALVRPGRLTAEQWDSSTEAGYPTETVGESLISTGAISRDLLASVVLSVIYDPLIQLFRAPEGAYEFAPDVVHWIGPYRTFSVDAIVSEVRRRTREADEMAPVVGSLEAIVRSARTLPESRGSVNLRRDDWEVVVAAANGLSVSDLAVELGRGRWSTARIVYRLATADLLMVTEETAAPEAEAPLEMPTASADVWGAPPIADEPTVSPEPEFGFDSQDGPPPLDQSVIEPDTAQDTGAADDPWALDDSPLAPSADDGGWDTDTSTTTEAADDPWGEFDKGADSNDDWNPAELYGDAPVEEASDDAGTQAATESVWGDGLDALGEPADATPEPAAIDNTGFGDAGFSSGGFGDDAGSGGEDEPPALHPDIAKALAESTYADSATAINAMAARLGAIESDDDNDDWDTGGATESSDDGFWSSESSGSGEEDFIWKPAVWDTGVESAPLPQRGGGRATADVGAAPAGDPTSDPSWLNNLYSEFMPSDQPAAPVEGAPGAVTDPSAAPKQRTLKRLMSAIRRL